MKKATTKFDVLFLIDSGIGNALEAFYAVEYCLESGAKTGVFLFEINKSFQEYLRDCYGEQVILKSLENVETRHLIHSFTYCGKIKIKYQHYFYIDANAHTSKNLSETELYLSVVKALFKSNFQSFSLRYLKENYSDNVKALNIEQKIVCFPGSTPENAVKRWPYYKELNKQLGKKNLIFIGGKGDYCFEYSYIYPKFIAKIIPQIFLNLPKVWRFFKKLNFLNPYAHFNELKKLPNAYFNQFSWAELVAVMRHCKAYIGNDGGLTHLAGVAGAKGMVLFGATSVEKNKTYNPEIKPIKLNYPCQPCQFGAAGIFTVKYFINCPYGVRCMQDLKTDFIFNLLKKI